jgi:hypothetical protein
LYKIRRCFNFVLDNFMIIFTPEFICMKRILFLVIIFLFSVRLFSEERQIQISQLPEKSQLIISSYFKDYSIISVVVEKRASLTQYEVLFSDGDKIQFNKEGKWTEIKCNKHAVPDNFVPYKIKEVISTSFSENYVTEIEHDDKLYEIVLDNKIELTFNSSCRLIDIDK